MEEEKQNIIDVREMALKWTTKGEIYKVLTTTGEIYLPPIDQINWDYIRDILWGDKPEVVEINLKYISWNEVKIIEVPHIEGLRIPEILNFARRHWNIGKYLPEYEWEKYSSRKWIWNVGKLAHHLII